MPPPSVGVAHSRSGTRSEARGGSGWSEDTSCMNVLLYILVGKTDNSDQALATCLQTIRYDI